MKAKIIDKKEPYSEIVKDNPTIRKSSFKYSRRLARPKLPKKV